MWEDEQEVWEDEQEVWEDEQEVWEDEQEVWEDRQEVRRKKRREKRSVIGQEKREADRKNSISGQETGIATHKRLVMDTVIRKDGGRQRGHEGLDRKQVYRTVACADRK